MYYHRLPEDILVVPWFSDRRIPLNDTISQMVGERRGVMDDGGRYPTSGRTSHVEFCCLKTGNFTLEKGFLVIVGVTFFLGWAGVMGGADTHTAWIT